MLNIVLFGPPGAGKGTQAQKLIEKYQLVHLSTGDIFRANLKAETELGLLARSYMDAGQLVPDDVTIKMLEAEVKKHPIAKGFIFDGFPRTKAQALALDVFLKNKATSISMMLALEVSETELKKRLLLRGQDSGRPDDKNPEVIQNRINVYTNETLPVKEFYLAQGKYYGVIGVGDIEDIFNKLCFVIDTNREAKKKVTPPATKKIKEDIKKKDVKKVTLPKKSSRAKKATYKKTVKKAVKKVTKKIVKKKAIPSKSAKKVVKKTARKVVKKIAKKTIRQAGATVVKKKVSPKKAAKKVTPKKVVKKKVAKKVNSSAKKKK